MLEVGGAVAIELGGRAERVGYRRVVCRLLYMPCTRHGPGWAVRIARVPAGSGWAMSGTSCEAIAAAVREVLSVRGPMAEDDLLGVLVADGVDLGPDPEDMLTDVLDQHAELVMPLADERWAWIPALLDGRIFTHRLSALEAEHD